MYTQEYRAGLVARMRAEDVSPSALARILREEEIAARARATRVTEDRIGRYALKRGTRPPFQPSKRTPSVNTLTNWLRAADSHEADDVVRLRRAVHRVGPLTPAHLAKALELLGWDLTIAVDRLGATHVGAVEAWLAGEVRIPPPVAAHVRTLVDCIAGRAPSPAKGVGGEDEKALGAHSPRGGRFGAALASWGCVV